ncbi:hypothetical protein HWV62_889 [Athelia sp. TMB]|nr:hypothetical protein HWV62_889 [Athelia sp. TMB]
MLPMLLVSLLSAFALLCMFVPSVRTCLLAVDDSLDAHEASMALVALRKPFRESGPPQNMAQLIMLRHKIQSSPRRRKSVSHMRQSSRSFSITPTRPRASQWMRFRKTFGSQHH